MLAASTTILTSLISQPAGKPWFCTYLTHSFLLILTHFADISAGVVLQLLRQSQSRSTCAHSHQNRLQPDLKRDSVKDPASQFQKRQGNKHLNIRAALITENELHPTQSHFSHLFIICTKGA